MHDPSIEAKLKGKGENKGDTSPATEKWIESQLNQINFEEECGDNKLVTPAIKRAQKKSELLQEIKKEDKSDLLIKASEIVYSEGLSILGSQKYEQVINAFQSMQERMDKIDLEKEMDQNFRTLLEVQDQTLVSLDEIAIHMFANARYSDCIAVCALLSTLVPENPDYLLRAGMAAQNEGDRAFAIDAYQGALEIDPKLLGAYLFSVECYLEEGDKAKAKAFLQKYKENAVGEVDPQWSELFSSLSQKI